MTATRPTPATIVLPTPEQILITREFAAPRALVFRAYTTPELVRRWWSAEFGQTMVAEIDLREGGRWRYVTTTAEGHEAGFHGVYQEIVPNERLVMTEVYEGMPDAQAVNTVTFTENAGRTTLHLLVQHATQEERDLHLNSGMETGMQQALHLLEEVACSLS
ncbi:SRPBCC family protein [Deinococcus oregonensis]|uniref:SRPBCC family protein n=1 Tax=Deinococcus oregonensis TaxID=1805970 RepID=A0ABV6AX24_9DEIO